MDGPEHLRIGDAERDAVTAALHEHFAQGRLTRDELDERLEATLAAKTAGDLRPITRDLPGPPPLGGSVEVSAGHPPERWGPQGLGWGGGRQGPWAGPWGGGPWAGPAMAGRPHGGPRVGPWAGHPVRGWRRRPYPPVMPLLVIGLIVSAFAGFGVLKFFLFAWLLMAVFQFTHRWRHHHHRGRW